MTGFATENLHELVFQHNKLARSPLKLSNVEARIFALCLACLHQDKEALSVEVSVKDVTPARNGEAYERVRDGCASLTSNAVKIETVEKASGLRTFIVTPLFAELRLEEGSGLLTGEFNEKLRQHLLQLKQEFTVCDVQTLLQLKSAYAHRLYWILKSWEKPSGTVTIERQALRDMLQGQEQPQSYPLWADFKRFVLEPALQELKGVEWQIAYDEKRRGRTVTALTFTIPMERPDRVEKLEKAGKLSPAELERYEKILKAKSQPLAEQYMRMQLAFKLTEPQARKICDGINTDEDFKKLTKVLYDVHLARVNNVPIKNLGAYTLNQIQQVLCN